jgi:hypothetical protein
MRKTICVNCLLTNSTVDQYSISAMSYTKYIYAKFYPEWRPGMKCTFSKPCKSEAVSFSAFCMWHGGKLPTYYSKMLGPTIREAIEQQLLATSDAAAFSLREEVELSKQFVIARVEQWQLAHDLPTTDKRRYIAIELAELNLTAAIESVNKLKLGAAKVLSLNRLGRLNAQNVWAVVEQIVRIAHESFSEFPDLVIGFETKIREHVRLFEMENESKGTTLTPDIDVTAMDNTISQFE